MNYELIPHNPKNENMISVRKHKKNNAPETYRFVNWPWHCHEELECILVTGEGDFTIKLEDGSTFVLNKNDFIVFGENVSHDISYMADDKVEYYVMHFSAKHFLKAMLGSDYNDHLYQIGSYALFNAADNDFTEGIASCIKKIYELKNGEATGIYELLFGLVCETIGYFRLLGFISRPAENDTKTTHSVMEAINYISTHFKERITPKEIAAHVYFSVDYLGKVFKKATGKTIMEYITFVRIEEAKNLLLTTSMSISEVGAEVGFTSSSYFIRCFKKHCFATPHLYKKTKLRYVPYPNEKSKK